VGLRGRARAAGDSLLKDRPSDLGRIDDQGLWWEKPRGPDSAASGPLNWKKD